MRQRNSAYMQETKDHMPSFYASRTSQLPMYIVPEPIALAWTVRNMHASSNCHLSEANRPVCLVMSTCNYRYQVLLCLQTSEPRGPQTSPAHLAHSWRKALSQQEALILPSSPQPSLCLFA